MSNDHIQRQMDFIVEQQAKFSVDIEQLKEAQKQLTATVARMASESEIDRRETRDAINSLAREMREGFNNLIIANESTRELAAQAARLAIQANDRVGRLEEKPES